MPKVRFAPEGWLFIIPVMIFTAAADVMMAIPGIIVREPMIVVIESIATVINVRPFDDDWR